MKRLILLVIVIFASAVPVRAQEIYFPVVSKACPAIRIHSTRLCAEKICWGRGDAIIELITDFAEDAARGAKIYIEGFKLYYAGEETPGVWVPENNGRMYIYTTSWASLYFYLPWPQPERHDIDLEIDFGGGCKVLLQTSL